MKKEFVFVLGGLAIGFLLVSSLKKKKVVLFMGGLENNKNLKEQVSLFNSEILFNNSFSETLSL